MTLVWVSTEQYSGPPPAPVAPPVAPVFLIPPSSIEVRAEEEHDKHDRLMRQPPRLRLAAAFS